MLLKFRGILEFSPEDKTRKHKAQSAWKRVAIIKTDCDLDRYYAWFLKKRFNLELNKNLRKSHVTFINDKLDKFIFNDASKIFNGKEIDLLIEETDTFQNYQFVKKFNLNKYLNKLTTEKLDEFISAVEQVEYMKDGEESEIMVKRFSDSERRKFIQKLNIIHKQQSEKITKYLGKLIIHFRNS